MNALSHSTLSGIGGESWKSDPAPFFVSQTSSERDFQPKTYLFASLPVHFNSNLTGKKRCQRTFRCTNEGSGDYLFDIFLDLPMPDPKCRPCSHANSNDSGGNVSKIPPAASKSHEKPKKT
jgi:hypothetical protein